MAYPKSGVVPPGGFHYVEKSGGAEITLTGDSIETLAKVLTAYRLNNGLPPGDSRQDIVDFICGQWPHFCSDESTTLLSPIDQPPSAPLSKRVAVWIAGLWNLGSNNLISAEEAEKRAAICRVCPFNQDFRAGGCPSCVDGADRLAYVWLAGRTVKDPHSLKACRVSGAHLQAAIFANRQPADVLLPSGFPSACWRR